MKKKILDWIEYNRFTIVIPVLILIVWIVAFGCTPTTASPLTGNVVTADKLKIDYDTTIAKFKLAAEDLERQYEQQEMITQVITSLATGNITNWGALGNMLIAGGGIGLLFDNRRKNTVIAAMKRGQAT